MYLGRGVFRSVMLLLSRRDPDRAGLDGRPRHCAIAAARVREHDALRIVEIEVHGRAGRMRVVRQLRGQLEVATFQRNRGRQAFLNDVHFRSDGDLLERDRRHHLARQIRVI